MFPFSETLAQYTMRTIMTLMAQFKALIEFRDNIAAEWSVNAIEDDFLATVGDAWGGYSKDDVLRIDKLTKDFETWLDATTVVTLADGTTTETKSHRTLATRFYGPYQG
jgi:hypothetical protein